MIRFSKIFLSVTVALLLLWQLPWCYTFLAAQKQKPSFTLYSTVLGEFITMGDIKGEGINRYDEAGNTYTQEQVDSLLPLFYVRQLMTDERFPDSLHGVALVPREVQLAGFTFRSTPSDINSVKVPLYPLLESMSGRVDLVMPDDVFRLTDQGIEFIDMESNTVNAEKSAIFTKAMQKKGFRFPARRLAGNPTARKEYDEGYLVLDNGGHLFHLKMTCGRPYVRPIPLPDGMEVEHLFITEFRDHKTLGYLCTTDGRLHVLNNKTYEVIQSGIPAYHPTTDALTIYGDLFNWTVCIKNSEGSHYYALDADSYSLIRTLTFPNQGSSVWGLHFTSSQDKYVLPRL
ncbi:MAG: DUF4857 domain-containing protein [Bacteroides sp.]|nr:DUF4857 domain-containing protein [Bacteroides sp.]